MYKHILLPTDGSALALRGAKSGIRLAKALGARVSAVYVIPPYVPPLYGDAAAFIPAFDPGDYRKAMEKQAARALAAVQKEARAAGVRCKGLFLTDPQPFKGILRAARREKCDAIAMASHGRGGLGGLILGSETNRVLAHSKLPVVVMR
jgi:nucleotide-binding universal stress UspA family protein